MFLYYRSPQSPSNQSNLGLRAGALCTVIVKFCYALVRVLVRVEPQESPVFTELGTLVRLFTPLEGILPLLPFLLQMSRLPYILLRAWHGWALNLDIYELVTLSPV